MPEYHLNVLNKKRREILKKLQFLGNYRMYLAGGTALALQIGHRSSIDFDFYTRNNFQKGELLKAFKENLKEEEIKVIRDQDDTFEISIGGVHASFFYYPYKLLRQPLSIEGVSVVRSEDIAAMKLVAISQRGKRRDFFDMYYLISDFSLDKIIELTQEKFPEFDVYNGLRGMVFFNDADQDAEIKRIKVFDFKLSWRKVKKIIQQEVFKYQKTHIS